MATVIDRVGTWYRFGENGPLYEILGDGPILGNGEESVRIRVLNTGELVNYPVRALSEDIREA